MWKFSMVPALSAIAVLAVGSLNAAPGGDETASFTVEKMTCATCPIAVRKAMERVEGVKEVTVDFESKTAFVRYDASMTDASDIGAASTNVGFPATIRDGHDE